ncbi:MAG TPA: MmgE/PrpD family protein [Acidimicrobiales bacterium]|nr:MmgE/PrpD family protein [Acidimicrobiales bacterium]
MEAHQETITGGRMVTRELAEWVAGLRVDDVPDDVVDEAGRALADFLGESLFVGALKPWGRSIAAFCAQDGGGQPEATILATGERTLAARAALANGTMALGFEYADFGSGSRPYPFAVTAPLALAESRHRSGEDLAVAIVVGYEVMGRVFHATFERGKQIPFYVPSVYGTVAGSAGAARVLGLDAEHTNLALGLGCAFAGGTFQGHEEGAWQRSLNGGMAGERAVTAALLAQCGFRATELGLEGIQGFAKMYTGGNLDPAALLDGLGGSWFITGRWVKRYPMNTTLHAPVEALLKVMRANGLRHTDIDQIDAAWQKVEPFLAKQVVSTVVSAQASLPFALAVAAVRGQVGVDEFTDETVSDPVVQEMIGRTVVHQDEGLFAKARGSMPGRVTVRTRDGRELTAEVLHPSGSPGNPLTEDQFRAKFMDMVGRVLDDDQADELYRRARDLRHIGDVADLAPLLSPK